MPINQASLCLPLPLPPPTEAPPISSSIFSPGLLSIASYPSRGPARAYGAELCDYLRSEDVETRRTTARLLSRDLEGSLIKPLVDLCREPGFAGGMEAVEIVAAIGGPNAVGALGRMLHSLVPAAKVRALRLLADPRLASCDRGRALRAIARAIHDARKMVAVQAIASFGALCSEDEYFMMISPLIESPIAQAAVQPLSRFWSDRVLATLRSGLQSPWSIVRMTCLGVLEAIGRDDVLPVLREASSHPCEVVSARAAEIVMAFEARDEAASLDEVGARSAAHRERPRLQCLPGGITAAR